jgi:hypothetical protein
VVNWPEIDQGRTRADRQREIEAGNLEREQERERGKDKGRTAIVLRPVMVDRASGEADRRAAVERQQMQESLGLPHQTIRQPAPAEQLRREAVKTPVSDPAPRKQDAAGAILRPVLPAPAPSRGTQPPLISHDASFKDRGGNSEISRLTGIVAAAWSRLNKLADRLQTAFEPFRKRRAERGILRLRDALKPPIVPESPHLLRDLALPGKPLARAAWS